MDNTVASSKKELIMAEEDKKQSPESQAVSGEKANEDYKAKFENQEADYKKLQTEHNKAMEQLKTAKGTLDALEEYGAIDWAKVSGQSAEPAKENPPNQPNAHLQSLLQRQEGRILTLQFRMDNPDLREYEDDLVAPFVIKAKHQNPRKSQDEILKIASDNVRAFLKKHEETILEKQKSDKKKTDEQNASGLETSGQSAPKTNVVDEEESRQRYIDHRRKRKAEQIGAV